MSERKVCTGQCHGCAFKAGATANQEAENNMRGVLVALGGIPFYCHESMGWTPDQPGYPVGVEQSVSILTMREKLVGAGADPALIREQTDAARQKLRICGGWRFAILRLQQIGWFANAELRSVRRSMAMSALRALGGLNEEGVSDRVKHVRMIDLQDTMLWFVREAKDAKVNIDFLFGSRKHRRNRR